MPRRVRIFGALLLAAAAAGCSRSDDPQKARAAIESMRRAVLAGDGEAFVACFDATAEQKPCLVAVSEHMGAMLKFEQAMKKAYGADATKGRGVGEGLEELRDEGFLDGITIRIDGEKATAARAGDPRPMNLRKKGGAWKIDPGAMLAGPRGQKADLGKLAGSLEAMTRAVETATGRIGKEGYTAEKINRELTNEMMKAMMQAAPPPAPAP